MNSTQRKKIRDAAWAAAQADTARHFANYPLANGRKITLGYSAFVPSKTGCETGRRRVTVDVDLPGVKKVDISSLWKPKHKEWRSRRA